MHVQVHLFLPTLQYDVGADADADADNDTHEVESIMDVVGVESPQQLGVVVSTEYRVLLREVTTT